MRASIVLFIAFALCLSACADYQLHAKTAMWYHDKGNFQKALSAHGEINPKKKDRILFLLDRATIEHDAGDYKASIKSFQKAEELIERFGRQPITKEVGATFTNDNLLTYTSSDFERLLLRAYQILNYAAVGNIEDSLVEVRRINTYWSELYTPAEKRGYLKGAFAKYLSGLIWEAADKANDALIDYQVVMKLRSPPRWIREDILRTSKESGLKQRYADFSDKWDQQAAQTSSGDGMLIVVVEAGRSPEKVSSEYQSALQVIPVPVYRDRSGNSQKVRVLVDGVSQGETAILQDVGEMARGSLDHDMPAIIARAVARLVVKEGSAVAVGETVDRDLGILLGIALLATNQADTRSWLTLPENFQVWRGFLPQGRHEISLDFGSRPAKYADVFKGRTTLVIFRVL